MAEELRLKTSKKPTWANEDVLPAMLIGNFIIGPAAIIIAGGIGAIYGKNQMEKHLEEGKPVSSKQSIVNKGLAAGVFAGVIVASLLAAPLILAFEASALPVVGALLLGGAVIGGYTMGKSKKEERLAEYQEAKVQQAQGAGIGQSRSQEISQGVSQEITISPEEAQLLESRMKHSGQGNHSFAEAIEAQQSAGLQQSK